MGKMCFSAIIRILIWKESKIKDTLFDFNTNFFVMDRSPCTFVYYTNCKHNCTNFACYFFYNS